MAAPRRRPCLRPHVPDGVHRVYGTQVQRRRDEQGAKHDTLSVGPPYRLHPSPRSRRSRPISTNEGVSAPRRLHQLASHLHTPGYDFGDDALAYGIRLLATIGMSPIPNFDKA